MAARYPWMFRAAAVLFLFFGGVWLWRFGLTDYHPEQRHYGLAAGALSLLVGVFLLRGHKLAIGLSAADWALFLEGFAPTAHGPAILFLAGLAIVCCLYAVFAVRALKGRWDQGGQ